MRLAIPYDNGYIGQHFGHTEMFRIYTIKECYVTEVEDVPTLCSGHGLIPAFLLKNGVDAVICGGMGQGMANALASARIVVFGGISGEADKAVVDFLSGNLTPSYAASCSHHAGGHSCGNHNEITADDIASHGCGGCRGGSCCG